MDFMPESTPLTNRDRAHQIITRKNNITDHHSPTTSSEEEEEDMANCLIMLSHSVVSRLNDDKFDDLCGRRPEKLKTRSVTDMVRGVNSSIHSYDCKTCNRSFPSFQALGGHRASHKKPKLTVFDQPECSKEHTTVVYEENKNSQTKVHQCSICGSEFLSGQALGGHMRRHRTAPPSIISPLKAKFCPEVGIMNNHVVEKSPVLSLDLNLPPPEVADEGHLSFKFAVGSSQQPLVFSAPALVDCHY